MSGPGAGEQQLLDVQGLRTWFHTADGVVKAVDEVSLQVGRGEILGLVGESGCGKSVTSLSILRLVPYPGRVEAGRILFNGRNLLDMSKEELADLRGDDISMIFQQPTSSLNPVYRVGLQISEVFELHRRMTRQAGGAAAVEMLSRVGIPDPKRRALAYPHELSGGMAQRVMIAMALACRPDLLIADEPTTALDVTIQAQILEVLKTAQQATGAAIVMITHDLGVIAGLADRVLVMYAGRPVETGGVDDLFYRPRMPYTLGLLGSLPRLDIVERQPLTPVEGSPPSLVNLPPGCPFVPRCPLHVPICDELEPELQPILAPHHGPGHAAACYRQGEIESRQLTATDLFPATVAGPAAVARLPREQCDPLLTVEGLVRRYPLMKGAVFRRVVGEIHAVDGISFDIREGETLGLVGESGCGKTTTINEILNLVRPMSGRVVVLGHDAATLDRQQRRQLRRDLSVVFQDPMASLDPRMPVGDILAEGLKTYGVPDEQRAARVRELLRLVGLAAAHANRYPNEFSGGQRQRIGIARALALEPKVMVLDEPVSALDASIQAGVLNLLERLKATLGLAYLFVAHDLSVVRHIADRVAVMYLGRIAEIGETDRVFDTPAHPYTQALLSAVPIPDPLRASERKRIILEGDVPSPIDPPSGCRFHPR
ncbi:MAG: dipeptide ABC transporter ATP-binding protein, partial [Acidimicrobiia bacterium]